MTSFLLALVHDVAWRRDEQLDDAAHAVSDKGNHTRFN
jgi:hypothetical protein